MSSLSEQELRSIREELAAGGTPTVWFTSSAVGVPEGRSGKVISIGEPAEGDFIQVRPASTKDVLSFSAAEVTQVKPARKRSAAAKTTAAAASDSSTTARAEATPPAAPTSSGRTAGAASSGSKTDTATSGGRKSDVATGSKSAPSATTSAGKQSAGSSSSSKATANAASAGKGSSGKRPSRPSGATVTLAADEAGQWTVEVLTGKKRSVRPTQVSPNAVAEAAKALHEDVAAAVEPLIDAAKEQQRARVEQLRAELASAEQALGELDR